MRSLLIILLLFTNTSLISQANFKLPMMIHVTDVDTTYCLKSKVLHQQRFDTLVFVFEDEILVFHPCDRKKRVRKTVHESGIQRANRREVIQYNKTTKIIQEHIHRLNYQNKNSGVTERYSLVQDYFNGDRYIIHLVAITKEASFTFFITNYDQPGRRSFILGYNSSVCGE